LPQGREENDAEKEDKKSQKGKEEIEALTAMLGL
jgi:hypothetical protein